MSIKIQILEIRAILQIVESTQSVENDYGKNSGDRFAEKTFPASVAPLSVPEGCACACPQRAPPTAENRCREIFKVSAVLWLAA